MNFKTIRFCLLWLLPLAGSLCAAQAQFVYALNDAPTGNLVFGFRMDTETGALLPLPGFPVSLGGRGNNNGRMEELYFDRETSRLFAINTGSSTVSVLSVDANSGALTALPYSPISMPPPSNAGAWACLSVHPSGSPLVVGDRDSYRIATFSITAASAALVSTVSTGEGKSNPLSCAFSRDGDYFYTGINGSFDRFAGFAVNPISGIATSLPGSPFAAGHFQPLGYGTDLEGRLFASGGFGSPKYSIVYTTSAGIPTLASEVESKLSAGTHGVLHPAGYYVVSDRTGNQIGVYAISGTGAGTKLTATADTPIPSGGLFTSSLAIDRTGSFLIAAHGRSRNLSTYRFDVNTGKLASPMTQAADTLGTTGLIVGLAVAGPSYNFAGIATGSLSARRLDVLLQPRWTDRGQLRRVFVAAFVGVDLYFLTPTGWQLWTVGAFPAYAEGPLAERSIAILDGTIDLTALAGTRIYVGYGVDADEMLASGRYALVHTVR